MKEIDLKVKNWSKFFNKRSLQEKNFSETHQIENCGLLFSEEWEQKCKVSWESLEKENCNKMHRERAISCLECKRKVFFAENVEEAKKLVQQGHAFSLPSSSFRKASDFKSNNVYGFEWFTKEEYDETGPSLTVVRCFSSVLPRNLY